MVVLADDLPMSTAILPKIQSRDDLFLALFFHDIGKGQGGDHSVIGERIAHKVCGRWGLEPARIDTIAWLVRYHLIMSNTAFRL